MDSATTNWKLLRRTKILHISVLPDIVCLEKCFFYYLAQPPYQLDLKDTFKDFHPDLHCYNFGSKCECTMFTFSLLHWPRYPCLFVSKRECHSPFSLVMQHWFTKENIHVSTRAVFLIIFGWEISPKRYSLLCWMRKASILYIYRYKVSLERNILFESTWHLLHTNVEATRAMILFIYFFRSCIWIDPVWLPTVFKIAYFMLRKIKKVWNDMRVKLSNLSKLLKNVNCQ